MIRFFLFAIFAAALSATPVAARLWKPTPLQQAQDYAGINHNKDANGRVNLFWMASSTAATPTMKQLLDKYVVLNISHTTQGPGGGPPVWNDVEGVQVTDGGGQPLKEVIGSDIPPTLVGIIAQSQAGLAQATLGKGKIRWMVFESGTVNACAGGRLSVTYDGETYTFDTPMPGCPKP
jgi:hypothetical protein